MNGLPCDVRDEILFRMNLKSLAKMRCTNKHYRSHLSDNPQFKREYISRAGPNLLHMSTEGSTSIFYLRSSGSTSLRTTETLAFRFQILGASSGLLLLFTHRLCVANPVTMKFQLIKLPRSKRYPNKLANAICGFAVDQIDETTQRFKIVYMNELKRKAGSPDEMKYQFEINAGGSWRSSKTRITCPSSSLDKHKKPVYVNGSLHWMRDDGSIIAFNPETEEAQLIPVKFPQEPKFKTLLVPHGNDLTLILPTAQVIYVYALQNTLTDPKWVLVRQIGNQVVATHRPIRWDVVAYDGKCLLLRETQTQETEETKRTLYHHSVHRYDLKSNKWGVMGSIPSWCDAYRDFYLFEPWHSSVMGMDKEHNSTPFDDEHISSLSSIMGLIVGVSPENIETHLKLRSRQQQTHSTSKKQRN